MTIEKLKFLEKRLYRHHGGIYVGEGWADLIIELDKTLSEIDPHYQISQVKEKFGTLRYYTLHKTNRELYENYLDDPFNAAVSAAESKSQTTCEECGQEGSLRKDLSWMLTLCDQHHTELKQKINKKD